MNEKKIDNAIELDSITKSFGKNIVIKELSFNVQYSEKIAIFAPSGSGKTTLLNILSGIDKNFSGSFKIKYPFSIVFQEARLFPYMKLIENIYFPLKLNKMPITKDIVKKADEWLEITSLKGFENYYPCELSGGMKAKVSIIRSFINESKIMLMDEPFKSIDIQSKQCIINYIKENYKDMTLILVTHNIDELPLISTMIYKFSETPLHKFDKIFIDKDSNLSEILNKLF